MKLFLIVGTGSFLGGVFRFLLAPLIQAKTPAAFPLGTLSVNVIGCFVIGAIFGWSTRVAVSSEWQLFLMTGVCGGFTTFSSFSFETFSLLREGHYGYAFAYILASLFLGVLATYLAVSLLSKG